MTNPVIENVRKSLGRNEASPISPRPAVYPARQPESREAEIRRFFAELEQLTGSGGVVAPVDLPERLAGLVAEQGVHKAALWQTNRLKELKIAEVLEKAGVEIAPPGAGSLALAECDLGVTEADYLLPETGSIVLTSSAEKPRAVSLLPRIHLAIVTPACLRADLHQVFAEVAALPYLVIITGPSRTSDIELTTTIGVHGPRQLLVWMTGED